MSTYNCKFTSDGAIVYKYFGNDFNRSQQEITPASERKQYSFSKGAQKRFNQCLDNYANMYKSVIDTNPDLLKHTYHEGEFIKRPVFLTLTVPNQKLSDKEVYRHCFDPFMKSMKKQCGVSAYLWKAEAQLRGAIHYHVVLDGYIYHKIARKYWFNLMRKTGQLSKGQNLANSSRLAWIEAIKEPATLKRELAGYFSAELTGEGNLVYKHDREKKVRQIEGKAWGCSDNLRYDPATITGLSMSDIKDLKDIAIETKTIEDSNGNELAEVLVLHRSYTDKYGEDYEILVKTPYDDFKRRWHYEQALNVYNNGKVPEGLMKYIYDNPEFTVFEPIKRKKNERKNPTIPVQSDNRHILRVA